MKYATPAEEAQQHVDADCTHTHTHIHMNKLHERRWATASMLSNLLLTSLQHVIFGSVVRCVLSDVVGRIRLDVARAIGKVHTGVHGTHPTQKYAGYFGWRKMSVRAFAFRIATRSMYAGAGAPSRTRSLDAQAHKRHPSCGGAERCVHAFQTDVYARTNRKTLWSKHIAWLIIIA